MVQTLRVPQTAHGEVVKKWGLAPSDLVKSRRNDRPARCLSPFFHSLGVCPLLNFVLRQPLKVLRDLVENQIGALRIGDEEAKGHRRRLG